MYNELTLHHLAHKGLVPQLDCRALHQSCEDVDEPRDFSFIFQRFFIHIYILVLVYRCHRFIVLCRSTGAYIQILLQILIRDMIQFGTIFAVFLFSFSGAFYLALRGEVRFQEGSSCTANVDCNFTNSENGSGIVPVLNTSINLYPYETS